MTTAVASDRLVDEEVARLPVDPTAMVVFGATGDLARRKLLPAFYNLAHDGALPDRFALIGLARADMDNEAFRAMAAEAVRTFSRRRPDESILAELLRRACFVCGGFEEATAYDALGAALAGRDRTAGVPLNRGFYLATAPRFFASIVEQLGAHRLHRPKAAEARVIIEKPFGHSLEEARALNRRVLAVLDERQVFRIDHYLGKETVQNLLALRFANQLFEPVWNGHYIDSVQITAAEDVGVESRAGYYDEAGALRDLVQNHLLQLLCHIAMEPPVRFEADEVRNEKVKVLMAISTPPLDEVGTMAVRAQYGPGEVGGAPVPGYLDEPGVPPDSHTETYAALRLEVDNWRWAGVPFYLRTGKRLARKLTEIAVFLKPVPHLLFEPTGSIGVEPNKLILTVQPSEGVSLSLAAKIPGVLGSGGRMVLRPVLAQYLYSTSFLSQSPEAYERLLLDAMRGDATLFTRNDEAEAQWRICDPILRAWQTAPGPLPRYAAGSQGPGDAASILLPGHAWRTI